LSKLSEFMPYLKHVFRIGPAELILSAVDLRSPPDAPPVTFTLIFAGPRDPVLPEGRYEASVAGGPVWILYIMPIHTHDRARQDYQVVFN
jgi:hypothetical protein